MVPSDFPRSSMQTVSPLSDGLVPRNAASVKAPRPEKPEIHPLTREQARMFLDAARSDRFEALYVVAIHCGLREGELLGSKWGTWTWRRERYTSGAPSRRFVPDTSSRSPRTARAAP